MVFMYNKKMNKLMIGQALLFGLIIIFFGIIIVREKVPSLKVKNVTRDINNYYEENYSTLNVRVGDLKYNEEDNSYSITYYDRDYNDLNFTIKSINNKITDNYEENYVKGKKVIEKCEDLVLEKYNEVFKNTNYQNIKVEFKNLNKYNEAQVIDILERNIYNGGLFSISYYVKGKSIILEKEKEVLNKYNEIFNNTIYQNIKVEFKDLDQYSDIEKKDILEDNIYNTGYYSISYYVKVDNLDEVYLNNLIDSFNNIALNNGLVANSYSVTFNNNGIIKIVEGRI